jgi:hypothetical protein
VALSLTPGDELWHAPPAWLAALAWGAWLVTGALALNFPVGRAVWQRAVRSVELTAAIDIATAVAFAAGVWMQTLPQPRFGPPGRRWLLRALVLSPLVHVTVNYLFSRGGAGGPSGLSPRGLALFAVMACVVPIPALLFLHLRHLALRMGRPRMADHCKVVSIGATASLAGIAWVQIVTAPAVAELASAAGLVFYLWSLFLLTRFAVAFGGARRRSAAAWRTAEEVGRVHAVLIGKP